VLPFVTNRDCIPFQLNFDFDTLIARINETSGIYTVSAADLGLLDSTDLSGFKAHGGKLIVYHGAADGAFSVNTTTNWYNGVTAGDHKAADYARLFVVPGMNHCGGGPSTDDFDMFPEVINWVENGVAPDSVIANASSPGYFGVDSRSRPLCAYPKQARYNGSGDINDASNFTCEGNGKSWNNPASGNGNSAPGGGNSNNPANSQNPNANPGSQSNGPGGGKK
jgi:feruloyl esterase